MSSGTVKASTYATSDTASYIYAEKAAGNFVRHDKTKIVSGDSIAAGALPYASAANTMSNLAIGSTGDGLIVAAGVPSWTTAPDALVLLQRQTFSGVATVDFTTGFSTGYDAYLYVLTGVYASAVTSHLGCVFSLDAGGLWASSPNSWASMIYAVSGGLFFEGNTAVGSRMAASLGMTDADSASGFVYVHTSATHATYLSSVQYSSNPTLCRGGGHAATATIVNGVRFSASNTGGNITGTIAMYGIKNT